MAAHRSEPFLRAVSELRARLAAGRYPPDSRLSAAELAAEFGLSPTPVREALALLAGEDLLEDRRGQGFFLRRLSGRDIADLYGLALAHLQIALRRAGGAPAPPRDEQVATLAGDPPTEPATARAAADRLFAAWVAAAGGDLLLRSFLRVQLQLAPLRPLEPVCLPGLAAEYAELCAAEDGRAGARLASARRFFRRRIRVAGRLAAALETAAGPGRRWRVDRE